MHKDHDAPSQSTSIIPSVCTCGVIVTIIISFIYLRTTDPRGSPFTIGPFALLSFCILAFLALYTFFLTMFDNSSRVPTYWARTPKKPLTVEEDEIVSSCIEVKGNSSKRFCKNKNCLTWKPDRTHHCRRTNQCYLRFDHHCMFVNNTIGAGNHKYFFLFLFYAVVGCAFAAIDVSTVAFPSEKPFLPFSFVMQYLALFVFSGAFSLAIACFFAFHLYMTAFGYTTVEFNEKRGSYQNGRLYQNPFNCGLFSNFAQVMGSNPYMWFVPSRNDVFPGNGVTFPINITHPQERQDANDVLQQSPVVPSKSAATAQSTAGRRVSQSIPSVGAVVAGAAPRGSVIKTRGSIIKKVQ